MPYIKYERREKIAMLDNPRTVGELNYLITSACVEWIERNDLSYSTINEVIGVLECAKLEFYRRMASPYEDKRKEENGDVY
jgi:hypothetical protein